MKKNIYILLLCLCLFTTPVSALSYEEVINGMKNGQEKFDFVDINEYHSFVKPYWTNEISSSWSGFYAYQSFRMQDYEYSTKKPRLTFQPRNGVDIAKEHQLALSKARDLINEFNLEPKYSDIEFAFSIYHKRYPEYRYTKFLPSDYFNGGGNCTAHTWIFEALLDELGIENKVGHTRYDNEPHIYNQFKINGKWYGADLTWNKFGFSDWGNF